MDFSLIIVIIHSFIYLFIHLLFHIFFTVPPEGADDCKTWAKSVVNEYKCWTYTAFIRGLANTRSESQKEALVDEMYARLEKEVAAQGPTVFENRQLMNFVFARKI